MTRNANGLDAASSEMHETIMELEAVSFQAPWKETSRILENVFLHIGIRDKIKQIKHGGSFCFEQSDPIPSIYTGIYVSRDRAGHDAKTTITLGTHLESVWSMAEVIRTIHYTLAIEDVEAKWSIRKKTYTFSDLAALWTRCIAFNVTTIAEAGDILARCFCCHDHCTLNDKKEITYRFPFLTENDIRRHHVRTLEMTGENTDNEIVSLTGKLDVYGMRVIISNRMNTVHVTVDMTSILLHWNRYELFEDILPLLREREISYRPYRPGLETYRNLKEEDQTC